MNELEQMRAERDAAIAACNAKHAALLAVLNSCVHPDTAVRAVLVDLKPIRKALKISVDTTVNLE